MPNSFALPGVQNGPLDVVYETSGTAAGLDLATQLVRVGGTVVMFGHQRGAVTIDGTQWHLKGLRVLNASPMIAEDFHQIFYRTAALMSAGRLSLDGLVTHVADAIEAISVLTASSDGDYIKGAITFGLNRDGSSGDASAAG
jgi:threonine dehydrogenase-like Zn-dependent dehydrogenase